MRGAVARDVRLVMPGATYYARPGAATPFDQRVMAFVGRSSAPNLRLDPCLSLAASEFGRHIAPRADGSLHLPKELQAAVLHHAGCTDGWVASYVFFSSVEDGDDFFEHLGQTLGKAGEANWLGVGRAKAKAPYRWAYSIFLAERHASFEPMPRALSPGQTLTVAGKLLGGLKEPRVLLLEPGGDVINLDVRQGPGARFSASSSVGRVVGEHWVELLATGPMGPRVVALFPVYVGQPAPTTVHLPAPPDESMVVTESDAEQLMFKLLNEDRRRFGLAPLVWDEDVAKIARGHSADMKEHQFFAHVSPQRGTLENRFGKAGYAARAMAENISRNNSVYDAEEGLMLSLGHRENILNTQFTHVGVGVVFGEDEYGRRVMFLTQNFATPQRKWTGDRFRARIIKSIQAGRKRKVLADIRQDDTLQTIAARYARLSDPGSGGQSADKLSELIRVALSEKGFSYRAFYIQSHTVLDPADVQVPEAALRAHVSRVGVGVYPSKQPSGSVLWKTLILLTEH